MSTVILVVWERIELSLRAYETQVSTKLPHRIGEGGENRTLTHGFGDRSSTVELHQHWRCVTESNRVLSCLGFAIPPLTVRATHRIKKPSKIFIWEGSLIRYIFDIRYIEPPHMRIYSPQSGVINQFCVCLCESFICNKVPLFVLLLYSILLL